MEKILKFLRLVDPIWLITWVVIYVGFMTISAFFPELWEVAILKVLGVALCTVYAFRKFKNAPLLVIALGFTTLADVILALDNVSFYGVLVFCIAQFFHAARMSNINSSHFVTYLVSASIIFFILTLIFKVDPMYSIAAIYGTGLISNIFLAFRWRHKEKRPASLNAVIGFLLFFCCDFCVGISYLSTTHVLPAQLAVFANYFAWAFYYPAQVFISNSPTKLSKMTFHLKALKKTSTH